MTKHAAPVVLLVLLLLPAWAMAHEQIAPAKSRWPEPYQRPISGALQELANSSTDVIVADVVYTAPSKAMEGARDNAKLDVVRVLLGETEPGQTIDLYYHLLWTDDSYSVLEPLKFEPGKRYVVFLKSHLELTAPLGDLRLPRDEFVKAGARVKYALTDAKFSVLPERIDQEAEIAAAIRKAHGDTRGQWSPPTSAFKGRLIAYRAEPVNETTVFKVYLDLFNVTGGNGRAAFDFSRATFTWQVVDSQGQRVPGLSPTGNERAAPLSVEVVDSQASSRSLLSMATGPIPRGGAGYLNLGSGHAWAFKPGDTGRYYLSGTIEISPTDDRQQWFGTLVLPKVALPID